MQHQVFISYARVEQEQALRLASLLGAFDMDPWVDQTSIPVSVPWMDEITKGIRSAEMVLILDSPAWRASKNCAAELAIAEGLNKRVVWLDIAASPDEWLARAQEAYGTLSDDEVLRATLLGDSFRWEAAGRQGSHLATGKRLNWFRAHRRQHAQLVDSIANAYIDRSTRARRIRRLLAVTASVLTVALMIGARVTQRADELVAERYQETLAEQSLAYTLTGTVRADAYRGLRETIERAADTPGWVADEALSRALDVTLPVVIDNPGGQRPARAAALAEGARVEQGGNSAVWKGLDNSVWLQAGASAHARVPVSGNASAMAWSPDGARLAVADAEGVRVVRAETGRTIQVLRGLDGAVDALRWAGPESVEGRAGAITARWQVSEQILFADPLVGFVGARSNAERTRTVALRSDGSYVLVTDGDSVSEPLRLPDLTSAYAIATTADGWLIGGADAAANGVLLRLDGEGTVATTWPLGECSPSAVAEGRGGVAWVACFADFAVTRVDLSTGETTQVPIDGQPLALVEDLNGDLLVRTYGSNMFRLPPSGRPVEVQPLGSVCMGAASVLEESGD